ncbi:MAG: hypothetical protein IT379_08315, partial [Deltaproteobacteria bacterium]|nr:hypothetical protein [Deltaproteobacteria bacterium]
MHLGPTLPDVRKVLAAIALVALFLVADVVLLVWLGTLVGFWPAVGL